MKLTEEQRKYHEQAVEILQKDKLTFDDKYFVLEHWLPGATNDIGKIASYFTPRGMAHNFCLEAGTGNVIDLCAGIGMLSFQLYRFNQERVKLTCVEINHEFVEVGKKILPEATWIRGDVLDKDLILSLGKFDNVISNPPFGNIKTGNKAKWLKYKGSEFEYKVIEIGSYLAEYRGAFILPQMSCPFRISGKNPKGVYDNSYIMKKYQRFLDQTGLELSPNCGIDISEYTDDWIGTSQLCEIAICEYEEIRMEQEEQENKQITLFDF